MVLRLMRLLKAFLIKFRFPNKHNFHFSVIIWLNIKLIFQEYKHPIYRQTGNKNKFISHLSILDLIMNYDNDNIIFRFNEPIEVVLQK